MPDVKIDRLSLHLAGMSEQDGRRLARLIADRLAEASVPGAGGNIESMESKTETENGASPESLSSRIAADLLRQMARTL